MKYFTLLVALCATLFSTHSSAQTYPIFTEGYGSGISFAPFGGSTNNVTDDATVAYSGTHSLKIEVTTGYTGGALVGAAQDLSAYNAVSFWVKASAAKTLNVSGLGNNGADATLQTELTNVALTTTWTKVIIPIPNPAKFTSVTGLFHFAEGSNEGAYTIWMDDIQYETTTVGTATATINAQSFTKAIGETFTPNSNGTCTFSGVPGTLIVNSIYFTYASANSAIATMNGATGVGTAVAAGTTTITAMLGAVAATGGPITVTVTAAPTGPTTAAATPTKLAADVKSLFSNAYTDLPTDTWRTSWSSAGALTDLQIAGNDTKKYENLNYAGIGFEGVKKIDATLMTGFHLDMWTLDPATAGFKVKLVDFGADGAFGGGDDTESGDIALTTPGGASSWSSYDLPLSAFMGTGKLAARANLSQMVIVSAGKTIWIDNVYFYKTNEPTTAAPTPTNLATNVKSLFSNAYTNLPTDTWRTGWSSAGALTDLQIAGNDTKKYESLNYAGITFEGGNKIDATLMTGFHLDIWTADAATAGFKVKLVDFGADGNYGGGDDTDSGEIPLAVPGGASSWSSYDLPLSAFTGMGKLAARANLAQMVIVSAGKTIWIDNVYFYKEPPTEPVAAATAPTLPSANVISMYSDNYTNVGMGWNKHGTGPVRTEITVAGSMIQKYTGLGFSIAEPTAVINTVNATHMHIDLWSPTALAAGVFKVKLVDYGNNAVNGFSPTAGDDTEGEVSAPAIAAATWVSWDIPFTDFATAGMTNKAHIGQLIPSGGGTVFMDNIYFYSASVLAVELATVKAKAVNNTTVLNWSTSSEKDNAGFTIERSADATNFTAIGNVKGNGTTNAASDYTFTDATPLTGVNYYRLRQADFNGKESFSKVVSVAFGKNVLVLKNTLVQNTLEVTVSESEKGPLSIFNVSGQLVFSAKVQGTQVLDVSSLTAGVYIVRMGTGEARRFMKN